MFRNPRLYVIFDATKSTSWRSRTLYKYFDDRHPHQVHRCLLKLLTTSLIEFELINFNINTLLSNSLKLTSETYFAATSVTSEKITILTTAIDSTTKKKPPKTHMASTSVTQKKPLLTFGIIADVQYADAEVGTDFSKIRTRYYRNSLNLLKNAVNDWKRCQDPVSFVLQLGDLIDGKCKAGGHMTSQTALNTALQPFLSLRVPVHHLVGNHELYNFNRSFCLKSPLNTALTTDIQCQTDCLYYTFLPHRKLRIVVLDTYELSVLGYSDDAENEYYKKAQALLQERNPNAEKNDTTGLQGLERRWAAFNGGVGEKQLQWLAQVLERAQSKEENVIIASHIGYHSRLPEDYSVCLSWSCQEVMDIVHRYQCVIGIFAGHEHAGHQHLDEGKVQHISFQGVIETEPGSNAYATACLWDQELAISGVGGVPNFTIPLIYPV